jgi:hypothetical protein
MTDFVDLATPAAFEGETIYCTTKYLEYLNAPDKPKVEVVRPLIVIPVEGYHWITPRIAYYKSSGSSNAGTDNKLKQLIRKYMWFPTIMIFTERDDTLIRKIMKISTPDAKFADGYILKYPSPIFSKYGPNQSVQMGSVAFYRQPFIDISPQYGMLSPYLKLDILYSKYLETRTRLPQEHAKQAATKLEDFQTFIGVMYQYCYNWKQIQDSIRLSLNTFTQEGEKLKVNDIQLDENVELMDMCNFVLTHVIVNEFTRDPSIREMTAPEKIKFSRNNIRVIYEESLVRTDCPKSIINFLFYNSAINERLCETSVPASKHYNNDEIKEMFRPYYDTMYLGKELSYENMFEPLHESKGETCIGDLPQRVEKERLESINNIADRQIPPLPPTQLSSQLVFPHIPPHPHKGGTLVRRKIKRHNITHVKRRRCKKHRKTKKQFRRL